MLTRRQLLASAAAPAAWSQTRRPNVLIILTDDQGYGDFSCHGNPVLKTPNIDRLHVTRASASPTSTPRPCARRRAASCSPAWMPCRNGATSVTAGRALDPARPAH